MKEQKYERVVIYKVSDFLEGDIIKSSRITRIADVVVERPKKEVVQEVEVDPGEGFRLLAVGDIAKEGDESTLNRGRTWEPLHVVGVIGPHANPMRRALEKEVSKSWAEQHRDELVVGQWYQRLMVQQWGPYKFTGVARVESENGRESEPLNRVYAEFEEPDGTPCSVRACESNPFIPCNPPSTVAPQEGEEEMETIPIRDPYKLKEGDSFGIFTLVSYDYDHETNEWLLISDSDDDVIKVDDRVLAGMLIMAPVRRRKSKPEPPKTPFWEGEAIVGTLNGESFIGLTILPSEFKYGSRVKVTVEAI